MMQGLPFTLRQLAVFEALAETRSFRRSAELLGISQASVSSQVKTLEEQLGVALVLRRAGKRPELSQEGENFLGDLRTFLAAAGQLASHRRREHSRTETIRYRLLLGQGLADNYVRPKLDKFLTHHPHLILEFDTRTPSEQSDLAARSGHYDFVLIHQDSDLPLHPAMHSLGLIPSGIFGDRRFAEGRELPLSADDVSRLPFAFSTSADEAEERRLQQRLSRYGVKLENIVARVQFFDVIIAMLDRGQAVANLPSAMIPFELRQRIVRLFPMGDWRLIYLRKDRARQEDRDAIERFLLDSVLNDPAYVLIEERAANLNVHQAQSDQWQLPDVTSRWQADT